MDSTLIIFLIFIFSIACWNLKCKTRTYRLMCNFQHTPTLPIIGNLWELIKHMKNPITLSERWSKMCPNLTCVWFGFIPTLIVYNAKDAEILLSSSNLINKYYPYKFLKSWLGSGLLINSGEKWKSRRKLLTPSFHFRILENFLSVFNKQSEILVDTLKGYTNKPSFDLYPLISLCTLDIICESVIGVEVNAQINSKSEYVEAVEKIKKVIAYRINYLPFLPEFLFSLIFPVYSKCLKILHKFSDKVIKERRAALEDIEETDFSKKKRLAFLDLLIEASDNGRILSDREIRDEVDTFVFAGHDTTAVALSWTFYFLGISQHVQDKVIEELDSIFGEDKCREATLDDLSRMKYLECVIKETIRLTPPVPAVVRKLRQDFVIGGKTAPAGVTVIINFISLHRDPNIFPNPGKFNPERFIGENAMGRHPYAYTPFSAGPRNCIGQKYAMLELKVVLSRVLRSFRFKSLQPEALVKPEFVSAPKDGTLVQITLRTDV